MHIRGETRENCYVKYIVPSYNVYLNNETFEMYVSRLSDPLLTEEIHLKTLFELSLYLF